jgi:hypothetical protein
VSTALKTYQSPRAISQLRVYFIIISSIFMVTQSKD